MRPASPWHPTFYLDSPLFDSVAAAAASLHTGSGWPDATELARALEAHAVRTLPGRPLVAVPLRDGERNGAAAYELDTWHHGALRVRRDDWHDLLNVLAWCSLPATKAALNALHAAALIAAVGATELAETGAPQRGRRRDAATLLDESGVLLAVSRDDLAAHVRAMRWEALFVESRAALATHLRAFVFGHGLLEKALAPYVGITGHALILELPPDALRLPRAELLAEVDRRAARRLLDSGADFGPRDLAPFPLLGLPGVWPANEDPAFYRRTDYFRATRGVGRPDR